jgi:hypothetical protein
MENKTGLKTKRTTKKKKLKIKAHKMDKTVVEQQKEKGDYGRMRTHIRKTTRESRSNIVDFGHK